MDSNILLAIMPEKIDAGAWKETFRDIVEISEQGELSYCHELKWNNISITCNALAKPMYDKQFSVNRWIVGGDLVEGFIRDNFSLVDDIQYYRDLEMKKSREAQDNIEEENLYDKNYIIIWNGYAGNGRMHLWLLAIACLIYHRFPEATYIYSENNIMEYIRATAVTGSIIGEPVEIPSPYDVGSVIEPIGEMLDEIIQEHKYDCIKLEDLYYWDSPTDTISPDIEEALRHIIVQLNKNSKRHQELFDTLSSNR